MNNEPVDKKQPNLSEAMMQVQGIMGEVSVMGANDSEFESFHKIITALQNGELSPSEAVTQALAIKNAKQDYH